VFLDLGNGNNLIALLGLGGGSDDDIVTITRRTFFDGYHDPDYGTMSYGQRIVGQNLSKPKQLSPSNMPTLVHFRNPKQPVMLVIKKLFYELRCRNGSTWPPDDVSAFPLCPVMEEHKKVDGQRG
jgi:hypothetical protein